jgi:chromosome segregation protein
MLEKINPKQQAVLQDWLAGAYVVEEAVDALAASQRLNKGEYLVNKQGDIYTKHSVTYFAAQSILHGVLERQVQLDDLQQQLPPLQLDLTEAHQKVSQLEMDLQGLRADQHTHSVQLKTATQQAHQLSLALQQIKQTQHNNLQRQKTLQGDSALANEKLLKINDEITLKETLVVEISQNLTQLKYDQRVAETNKHQAELAFNEARNQFQSMERAHQEKSFNLKLNTNNINELRLKIDNLLHENSSLKLRSDEVSATLAATKMETL